ncbi:MAG: hypothetical protein ACI8PZ_001278 [Myxococcota bacterium]|jgi:hypothetical protein
MRFILAALLLAPSAAFAQTLTMVGACPGDIDIDASGLTAGGDVAFLFGLGAGSDVIPSGVCAGVATGLAGIRLGVKTTSADGTLSWPSLTVPGGACARSFQMLDLTTCTLTNVATITGGGGGLFPDACEGGADLLSTSPGGDMVVCDDPGDFTCEQDFGTLCPVDWKLCSPEQYNARNDGWAFAVPAEKALGTIYCRGDGGGGAGHFSVTYTGIATLGEDEILNCGYGSSLPSCATGYGCNEQSSKALCCAQDALCGNGIVDGPEELCDDGNDDEDDDCLKNCSWRVPGLHGFGGC